MSGDTAGRLTWQQPAQLTAAAVVGGEGSEARLPGRRRDIVVEGVAATVVASTDVVAWTTTGMSREMPRAWKLSTYFIIVFF